MLCRQIPSADRSEKNMIKVEQGHESLNVSWWNKLTSNILLVLGINEWTKSMLLLLKNRWSHNIGRNKDCSKSSFTSSFYTAAHNKDSGMIGRIWWLMYDTLYKWSNLNVILAHSSISLYNVLYWALQPHLNILHK